MPGTTSRKTALWEHLAASLKRFLIAGAIAISIGIPLCLMMGLNRWAKGVFNAPIEFYWPLRHRAYLPLMIIWLGIGETFGLRFHVAAS